MGDAFRADHDELFQRVHFSRRVRVEHRKKLVEITVGARRDESAGHYPMPWRFDRGMSGVAGVADLAACPAGQLPACSFRPADRLGDKLKRQLENVVKNKRDTLGGGEALEHDEQGESHLVVKGHPVGGIDYRRISVAVAARCHVFGAFAAPRRRLDVVETEPTGDHDQPAPGVIDATQRRLHQAEEGFLDDVLGRADIAQHPKREVDQIRTMRRPGLADLVIRRHRRPPRQLVVSSKGKDDVAPQNVTSGPLSHFEGFGRPTSHTHQRPVWDAKTNEVTT